MKEKKISRTSLNVKFTVRVSLSFFVCLNIVILQEWMTLKADPVHPNYVIFNRAIWKCYFYTGGHPMQTIRWLANILKVVCCLFTPPVGNIIEVLILMMSRSGFILFWITIWWLQQSLKSEPLTYITGTH